MASGGYPGSYNKGHVISGLDSNDDDSQKVFHAGTSERDGQIVTEGGRVLCATALGETVSSAQTKAYELAQRINWKDVYYRRDIGYRAIAREMNDVTIT
ncbi:MAG: phosphoribosylglycinamide synthetase C domain-containing protein, partial [Acidiferrobacterales bacterium]